jgi:hypothetical protein
VNSPFNYSPGFTPTKETLKMNLEKSETLSKKMDFIGLKNELNQVIFTLTYLVDLVHSLEIQSLYWMKPTESLLVKLAFHSSSINHLATNIPILRGVNGNTVSWVDISSLYVLARAQMECYLTFYDLIISPKSHEEGEFKFLLYKYSGIANRQGYYASTLENIAKKEEESQYLLSLKNQISTHPYYNSLSNDLQRQIKSRFPPARLQRWSELIKSSHLKDNYFLTTWKLYSNHAHSEYIGSIQLIDYFKNINETNRTVFNTLELTTMITSITIIELLNLYPQLISNYENEVNLESKSYINFWAKVGLKTDIQ